MGAGCEGKDVENLDPPTTGGNARLAVKQVNAELPSDPATPARGTRPGERNEEASAQKSMLKVSFRIHLEGKDDRTC